MARTWRLYTDELHGIQAAAPTLSLAWSLIRNKCHERQIQVPLMTQINEGRELSDQEVIALTNLQEA